MIMLISRWDGTQFVYRQNAGSNEYWNIIKLIRKYGLGPIRVKCDSGTLLMSSGRASGKGDGKTILEDI